MSRRPLPMKPWHLYDLVSYVAAKVPGSKVNPESHITYGKTKRDAMETFKTNHIGDFVLVSDSVEIPVTIRSTGSWFEGDPATISCNRA